MKMPSTSTLPETRAAALADHVNVYLADHPGNLVWGVRARDAVEHGWHGATADIAERLECLMETARKIGASDGAIGKALDRIVEELKREVGA